MWCCRGPEDSICHFYSGLRREIQEIVDYFQFAMFEEKE
jgi:hypothetical protein